MRIPKIWIDIHDRKWEFKELHGRMKSPIIEENIIREWMLNPVPFYSFYLGEYVIHESSEKMWKDIISWARTASTVGAKR